MPKEEGTSDHQQLHFTLAQQYEQATASTYYHRPAESPA